MTNHTEARTLAATAIAANEWLDAMPANLDCDHLFDQIADLTSDALAACGIDEEHELFDDTGVQLLREWLAANPE